MKQFTAAMFTVLIQAGNHHRLANELLNQEMVANVPQCRNLWFHDDVWGGIKDAAEWTAKAGETAVNTVKDGVEDAVDTVKDGVEDAVDWTVEAGKDVWDTMKKLPALVTGKSGGMDCAAQCKKRNYDSSWVKGTAPSCDGSCSGDCYSHHAYGTKQSRCVKGVKFEGHNMCLTGKKVCCCFWANFKPKVRYVSARVHWKGMFKDTTDLKQRLQIIIDQTGSKGEMKFPTKNKLIQSINKNLATLEGSKKLGPSEAALYSKALYKTSDLPGTSVLATCKRQEGTRKTSIWQEMIFFGDGTEVYTANFVCRQDIERPACPSAYCVDDACNKCKGVFKSLTRQPVPEPEQFDYQGQKDKIELRYDEKVYAAKQKNEENRDKAANYITDALIELDLDFDMTEEEVAKKRAELEIKKNKVYGRFTKRLEKKRNEILGEKQEEMKKIDAKRKASQKTRN